MRELTLRKPVQTITLDMSLTNITTAAWVELDASLDYACSAFEVFNPSGSSLSLATGGAGSEVALPYTIIPGGSSGIIPIELSRLVRLSAKAVDATANTGVLVINLFA